MRAKSFALLVLALGCGLVASIGITQVMSNRNADSGGAAGETETIFVALQDIPMGEILTAQLLRLEEWPKGKAPTGALTRIEEVEGRRTRAKFYSGEPILDNKLFAKGARNQGVTPLIPKGYRVVSVKVDKVTGGADLIFPGDRVDLLLSVSRNPNKGITQTETRTILQDVKVFAVNNVVNLEGGEDDPSSIPAATISLLVTPEQAQKITLATDLGSLRLVMRSPEDDEIAEVAEATPTDLFDGMDAADREKDSSLMDAPPDTSFTQFLKQQILSGAAPSQLAAQSFQRPVGEPRERHQIRIISGAEVRDVVLEAEAGDTESDSGPVRWKVADPGALPDISYTRAGQTEAVDAGGGPTLGPGENEGISAEPHQPPNEGSLKVQREQNE